MRAVNGQNVCDARDFSFSSISNCYSLGRTKAQREREDEKEEEEEEEEEMRGRQGRQASLPAPGECRARGTDTPLYRRQMKRAALGTLLTSGGLDSSRVECTLLSPPAVTGYMPARTPGALPGTYHVPPKWQCLPLPGLLCRSDKIMHRNLPNALIPSQLLGCCGFILHLWSCGT